MANEFIARNGLIAKADSIVTGSLTVTGGITGSILSASYAVTSSYTQTTATASYILSSTSSSYSSTSTSASYSLTASFFQSPIWSPTSSSYANPLWLPGNPGTATAPALDTIYVSPILMNRDVTAATIGIYAAATSAGVGASARLGIYYDNGNMLPGTLLYDAGLVTTSTTTVGFLEATVNKSLNNKSIYWVALVGSGSIKTAIAASNNLFFHPLLGAQATGTGVRNIAEYSLVSASSYNALPTSLPSTFSSYTIVAYTNTSVFIPPMIKLSY